MAAATPRGRRCTSTRLLLFSRNNFKQKQVLVRNATGSVSSSTVHDSAQMCIRLRVGRASSSIPGAHWQEQHMQTHTERVRHLHRQIEARKRLGKRRGRHYFSSSLMQRLALLKGEPVRELLRILCHSRSYRRDQLMMRRRQRETGVQIRVSRTCKVQAMQNEIIRMGACTFLRSDIAVAFQSTKDLFAASTAASTCIGTMACHRLSPPRWRPSPKRHRDSSIRLASMHRRYQTRHLTVRTWS